MKIITEGYDVPIVVVENRDDYFILDGHHRSFIEEKLLKKTIGAYVLRFPRNRNYRIQSKRPLGDLPVMDVTTIDNLILATWSQMLVILKYY